MPESQPPNQLWDETARQLPKIRSIQNRAFFSLDPAFIPMPWTLPDLPEQILHNQLIEERRYFASEGR